MANAGLLQRLDKVEIRQLKVEEETEQWKQEVNQRFDQQMFDANILIEQIVSGARTRIVLIDDYVTSEILQRFHTHAPGVPIDCYVKSRLATDELRKKFIDFRDQYPGTHCELHTFECSHDRWLIIDQTVYHFGASIKDLGKRWFSVDICTEYTADELIARLG